MKRLEAKYFQHLYDREPLYCKIRSHLCHQGREVSWEDLKQRHDEILESVGRNENGLPMPDHLYVDFISKHIHSNCFAYLIKFSASPTGYSRL